ncbi:MAG: prepilin-type cleavage/methylation domain-containing protein, partial [bacterium]
MEDNDGAMYHHHEGWVLDDGTQLDSLPATVDGCIGDGAGNSNAEKPWAILFQPYMKSRELMFCPSDPTVHSRFLATNIVDYNGGITEIGTECDVAPQGEQCRAQKDRTTMWSYLLNSIFTHKSCRYAMEGALNGFATDAALAALPDPNIIVFSERNSVALNSEANTDFGYIPQDDYDTWAGESA